MSGSSNSGSTNPQATPAQMAALYSKYLPQALATTTGQAPLVANTLAGSAAGANPIYTASGAQQLGTYAPDYAQAGNNLAQQQAFGQAQLLGGNGAVTALEGAGLNNLLNPAQAAANNQSVNLLNSVNMNGLSPGEYNATERSLNNANQSTGNLGVQNGTNTINNAMNFGGAFNNKIGILGSALGAANQTAANQTSSINPTNVALGAGNTTGNFGLQQYNPTQANSNLTAPLSFGSSFGNQIAGVAGASKGTTAGASGGCFLTTACCEYKGLPDNCEELQTLREFRDTYVPEFLVVEYYKTAPAITKMLDDKQLEYIYGVVCECVRDIKQGRKESALNRYTNMFTELKVS